MMDKPNYFVVTGGPGAGKSSVIEALHKQGYSVVEEAARNIIQQQKIQGGNATQTGDRLAFCRLLLEQYTKDFLYHDSLNELVFFDRGLPGLLAYRSIADSQEWQSTLSKIAKCVEKYRYNPKVFIFPPWEDIYTQDEERVHTFEQSVDAYYLLKNAYQSSGYELCEVPKLPVEERIRFLLANIK